MRALLCGAALLVGCGGPNEETLLDELRVLAVVLEPPELAPGESTTVSAVVVDPLAEGVEALIWTCADLGEGCLEAAAPAQGSTVATPVDGVISAEIAVPSALAGAVADGETVLPVPLWTLVCAPGLCDVIALAASAPAVGSEDAQPLSAFLADPSAAMAELPLSGTSLALTLLRVSQRADPITNPVLTSTLTALTAAPEESVDIPLTVASADTTTAYGYATGGGFDGTDAPVVDGTVTLTWIAPEEEGTYDLYIVVTGEDGGSAVWQMVATVE